MIIGPLVVLLLFLILVVSTKKEPVLERDKRSGDVELCLSDVGPFVLFPDTISEANYMIDIKWRKRGEEENNAT